MHALVLAVSLTLAQAPAASYDFADLPGTDGQKHSLADFKGKKAVVVVFTCNSCPVAVDYEDRIVAFARKHAGPDSGAAVVAICSNTVELDRLPKMQERAKEKGFPFPYLHDETQAVAKRFGATTTPEFFLLDADRKLAYRGAFDDKNKPGTATQQYLEPALEAVLAGKKPATSETVARGCAIRLARPKR